MYMSVLYYIAIFYSRGGGGGEGGHNFLGANLKEGRHFWALVLDILPALPPIINDRSLIHSDPNSSILRVYSRRSIEAFHI
jgi:hypothetical protein